MTNSDEENLLTKLQAGCPKTQRLFWNSAYKDVHIIALHVLKNTPDAGAVTVEVLSDFLMQGVHNVNSPPAMFAYLRIMTARRALRFMEKTKHNVPIDTMEIADLVSRCPEDDACLHSLLPHLDKCLEKLTPKTQQVLRLRYHREMTNERIGDLLGGSKQYIGRLLSRSIGLLRECMNSTLYGFDGAKGKGENGR